MKSCMSFNEDDFYGIKDDFGFQKNEVDILQVCEDGGC